MGDNAINQGKPHQPIQKRVMAIHDISCMGRCSLTVALPVISAFGLMVAPLPTALLSTHTGEFTGYAYLDLTDEMRRILDHWDTLQIPFQGIYSGFLGSEKQIAIVGALLDARRKDALVLVDPVMGDQGEVYATYTPAMVAGMGALCTMADVITPNITEACLLLDEPYRTDFTPADVKRFLFALLAKFGCQYAVITGVSMGDQYGAAAMSAGDGTFLFAGGPMFHQVFYGTGDLYASILMGCLMGGVSLEEANAAAVRLTTKAMQLSPATGLPLRYGVPFELILGDVEALARRSM